jgi:hypothetical protein
MNIENLIQKAQKILKENDMLDRGADEKQKNLDFTKAVLDAVNSHDDKMDKKLMQDFANQFCMSAISGNAAYAEEYERCKKMSTEELTASFENNDNIDVLAFVDLMLKEGAESDQSFEHQGLSVSMADMYEVYNHMKDKYSDFQKGDRLEDY